MVGHVPTTTGTTAASNNPDLKAYNSFRIIALFWKVRNKLNRRCFESTSKYWKCSRYSDATPRGACDHSSNSTPRARYATELCTVADLPRQRCASSTRETYSGLSILIPSICSMIFVQCISTRRGILGRKIAASNSNPPDHQQRTPKTTHVSAPSLHWPSNCP